MYKSKREIEKKLKQVKYSLKQFTRYEGRIFVNEGRDPQTGCLPLIIDLSSFTTQARSVLQYAYKEAKERGLVESYNAFVNSKPIFRCFKALRNGDIHEYIPGTNMTIEASSPIRSIDPETGVGVGEPVYLYIEGLDDLDNPKGRNSDTTITTTITKRLEPDDELIQCLTDEGRLDLVELAKKGEPLYELFECNGESNIFQLCRSYQECIEEFYDYGVKCGFIS